MKLNMKLLRDNELNWFRYLHKQKRLKLSEVVMRIIEELRLYQVQELILYFQLKHHVRIINDAFV